MSGHEKVVTLENYRNNKENKRIDDVSLFDMDMSDINKAIQFSNCMPDIAITETLLADSTNKENNKTIQEIVAEVYFNNYLYLSSDDYSDRDIKRVAKFIEGIYDFENTTSIAGHIIYQKHQKEREIWIDGYNSLLELL